MCMYIHVYILFYIHIHTVYLYVCKSTTTYGKSLSNISSQPIRLVMLRTYYPASKPEFPEKGQTASLEAPK